MTKLRLSPTLPFGLLFSVAILGLTLPAGAQQMRLMPQGKPGQQGSQPPAPTVVAEPLAMMIAGCDADLDALVTRAELQTCVARSFAAAEGASSGSIGYISQSDWALKWLGERTALPSPFSIDSNHDNRITLEEMQDSFGQAFARFDVDKNGSLSRAELVTIRTGLRGPAQPGQQGNPQGGPQAGRQPVPADR